MIVGNGLVKTFDRFRALDGLDIRVPTGAVYGLVGPNGAGKSTFLRHLAGVYRQDAGTLLIDGEQVFENPAVKQRIAYIPDEIFCFTQASLRDMMRYYNGLWTGFDRERFEKLGEVFSLDVKAPIRRMSRGMQKQAAFWLAMSQRPELLILDEPVDGLDPVMRRQIWSIVLGDVAENGTTVLISSHNLRELEDVCDHVGIIHQGKMMHESSLASMQEGIVKVQVVLPDGEALPEGLEVLRTEQVGRVQTCVIRGRAEEVQAAFAARSPLFCDLVPLTLEEIFIYELGGEDYAVQDILV